MSIPETTSAETFWRYGGGRCLFESRGEAWRDIKAWVTALPAKVHTLHMESVSEPFLAWITPGEIDFQERENGQPWTTNGIRKGSLFLTKAFCSSELLAGLSSVVDYAESAQADFQLAYV